MRTRLHIEAAAQGGFIVHGRERDYEGGAALFAGTLEECLTFMRKELTPEPAPAETSPLSQAEFARMFEKFCRPSLG